MGDLAGTNSNIQSDMFGNYIYKKKKNYSTDTLWKSVTLKASHSIRAYERMLRVEQQWIWT